MTIDPLFARHELNEEGRNAAITIAEDFTTLLHALEPVCSASPREFALAKTHLQQAKMWAVQAVAMRYPIAADAVTAGIHIVVNGEPVTVAGDPRGLVSTIIIRALHATGNKARNLDDWELRFPNGELVDVRSGPNEQFAIGVASGARFYLNTRAGVGG